MRRDATEVRAKTLAIFVIISTASSLWLTAAADRPDLELNPATELIEAVDLPPAEAPRVRHLEDGGPNGDPLETIVSAGAAVSCRIAIRENGDSWAVWHDRATGEIHYAVRNPVSKLWTAEARLSRPGDVCASPRVAHLGDQTFVGYEVQQGPFSSLQVTIVDDGPEPLPPFHSVAPLYFEGDRDLDLRSENGHVWVTWIASANTVEWSQFDFVSRTWSPPAVEPIAPGGVRDTRAALRARVLAE